MTDTDEQPLWQVAPYFSAHHQWLTRRIRQRVRPAPQIDTDHIADTFTPLSFSLAVSAVWDWDLRVEMVRMSRRTALQAFSLHKEQLGPSERFSLEQLVYEGWELGARWLRAGGIDEPHWFLGAIPVDVVLDDTVAEHGLAYLVTSDYPLECPAYVRVLTLDESPLIHPDEWRLDAILEEQRKAS